LNETGSEAADASCFCQHLTPPVNEFKVGHKLETFDPRNTTSTCIGTVIEVSGPRLRLRLDGTDDRNDFWLMCDSDLLHPFGYSSKNNRKIQPPLGFGNELSKWPKFLEKIISGAKEGVFAPDSCFKTPPTRLLRNDFKVGQKLEAVDPKNPHLICPATVKEVTLLKLLITFDGWSQSSQFWVSYASRDLFPVGWCKRAKHILQYPGNLEDSTVSHGTVAAAAASTALAASVSLKDTKKTSTNTSQSLRAAAVAPKSSRSASDSKPVSVDKENLKQSKSKESKKVGYTLIKAGATFKHITKCLYSTFKKKQYRFTGRPRIWYRGFKFKFLNFFWM
jgi:polycomb protein SCMH1